MKKVFLAVATVVLSTAVFAQVPAQSAEGQVSGSAASENATQAAVGQKAEANSAVTIQAELSKSIDAKKAKVGDEVTAKTTADAVTAAGMKIPRGTKLFGHVTEAKARSKDDAQSSLGFVFDRATLKSGQEVRLNAVVRGVIAPAAPTMSSDIMGGMSAQNSGGMTGTNPSTGRSEGGVLGPVGTAGQTASGVGSATGGVASDVGTTVGSAAGSTVGAAGQTVNGGVNGATGSVIGLKDVQLQTGSNAGASGHSGQTTTLTSSKTNVRLDGGTQLILSASIDSATAVSNK